MRNPKKGKGMVMTQHNGKLHSLEFDLRDVADDAEVNVVAQEAIGYLAKKIAAGDPS
jgi:hypothetical protein